MFYVGHREDFGPYVHYCSFTTNSKVWKSKAVFIHSDSELPESQMFACMQHFWRKTHTSVVLKKKKKYLMTKLMIIHSYFSVICVWVLDWRFVCLFESYRAMYRNSFILEQRLFLVRNNKKGGSFIWINSIISTCLFADFYNNFTNLESVYIRLSL